MTEQVGEPSARYIGNGGRMHNEGTHTPGEALFHAALEAVDCAVGLFGKTLDLVHWNAAFAQAVDAEVQLGAPLGAFLPV